MCSAGKNKTNVELIQDMMNQESLKTQEEGAMFVPPEHSRAINRTYYPYKGRVDLAEKKLKNPLQDQFSGELVGLGKRQYEKACIYCHGSKGLGEGVVAGKMIVKPLSLVSEKAMNYSDGRLYHIIHEGQGLMGGYSKQVPGEKERWALVNYVRMLQKQAVRSLEGQPPKDDKQQKADQ